MPGLDKSRFINWSESDDELLCGICLAVLDNPMVTHCCRQTYCRDCITQWLQTSNTCPNDRKALTYANLSQPSRSFINILYKLKVKCNFHSNGCNDIVLYGRYKSHIRDCKYNPEAICGDCGTKNGQRSKHNCVQLLLAKNKQLETANKELSATKISLEIQKNNLLKENLEYQQMNTNFHEVIKTAKEEKAYYLNALKLQITDMKNGALKLEKAIDAKTKTFHKTLQLRVDNIDKFFESAQRVFGPVISESGFEWRLKVINQNVNQCNYLGLYLGHKRVSCAEMWTKLNLEYSIIIQHLNGQTGKYIMEKCYLDAFAKFNYYGYANFIDAKYIFDASNHYIKDNSIILDVTISPAD